MMWVAPIGSKRKPKPTKEEKSLTKDLNTRIENLVDAYDFMRF
jgi:hypothetical protein